MGESRPFGPPSGDEFEGENIEDMIKEVRPPQERHVGGGAVLHDFGREDKPRVDRKSVV